MPHTHLTLSRVFLAGGRCPLPPRALGHSHHRQAKYPWEGEEDEPQFARVPGTMSECLRQAQCKELNEPSCMVRHTPHC